MALGLRHWQPQPHRGQHPDAGTKLLQADAHRDDLPYAGGYRRGQRFTVGQLALQATMTFTGTATGDQRRARRHALLAVFRQRHGLGPVSASSSPCTPSRPWSRWPAVRSATVDITVVVVRTTCRCSTSTGQSGLSGPTTGTRSPKRPVVSIADALRPARPTSTASARLAHGHDHELARRRTRESPPPATPPGRRSPAMDLRGVGRHHAPRRRHRRELPAGTASRRATSTSPTRRAPAQAGSSPSSRATVEARATPAPLGSRSRR